MSDTILNKLAIWLCYDNCNNLHRLLSIPRLPKYTVGPVPGHCLHVRVTFFVVVFFFFFFFCCCFFFFFRVAVFFLLQNAPIAMFSSVFLEFPRYFLEAPPYGVWVFK